MHTGAGTNVQQIVGCANRFLVVLDDNHRIAEVAQMLEGADQPVIIALVQADARLIQHIKNAHQARANLRGQSDALGLAAASVVAARNRLR